MFIDNSIVLKRIDQKQLHGNVEERQWQENCYEDPVSSESTIKLLYYDFICGHRDRDAKKLECETYETRNTYLPS